MLHCIALPDEAIVLSFSTIFDSFAAPGIIMYRFAAVSARRCPTRLATRCPAFLNALPAFALPNTSPVSISCSPNKGSMTPIDLVSRRSQAPKEPVVSLNKRLVLDTLVPSLFYPPIIIIKVFCSHFDRRLVTLDNKYKMRGNHCIYTSILFTPFVPRMGSILFFADFQLELHRRLRLRRCAPNC